MHALSLIHNFRGRFVEDGNPTFTGNKDDRSLQLYASNAGTFNDILLVGTDARVMTHGTDKVMVVCRNVQTCNRIKYLPCGRRKRHNCVPLWSRERSKTVLLLFTTSSLRGRAALFPHSAQLGADRNTYQSVLSSIFFGSSTRSGKSVGR